MTERIPTATCDNGKVSVRGAGGPDPPTGEEGKEVCELRLWSGWAPLHNRTHYAAAAARHWGCPPLALSHMLSSL